MNTKPLMDDTTAYWRINELKNYLYCPRISYYALCLGLDRETGLSRMGIEAEADVKTRMRRRKHALHAVVDGERHLDVTVTSHALQLIGKIDELVETVEGIYLVDYKDTDQDFGYWKTQLCAYQRCAEEHWTQPVMGCYVYSLPTQEYHRIKLTRRDYNKLESVLDDLAVMMAEERIPPPIKQRGKCYVCQYAHFCNDIF